jgi:hypothetical protein
MARVTFAPVQGTVPRTLEEAGRRIAALERALETFTRTIVLHRGTGTPEGAVIAPVGALYLRTDGGASTTLYVKESGTGSSGWIAK